MRGKRLVVLGALLAACRSDGTGPNVSRNQALAAAFDGMAQEAAQRGDVQAGAAFGAAAIAVRLGVRTSSITVSLGGRSVAYDAFVQSSNLSLPRLGDVDLRALIAWQGGERPSAVLYLATLADAATVAHPIEAGVPPADPRTIAAASWRDVAGRTTWVGLSGTAGIVQRGTGGACPGGSVSDRIQCTLATFSVTLDAEFSPLVGNDRRSVDHTRQLTIRTAGRGVNGAVLTVSQ